MGARTGPKALAGVPNVALGTPCPVNVLETVDVGIGAEVETGAPNREVGAEVETEAPKTGTADMDVDVDADTDADAEGSEPNMQVLPPKACDALLCPPKIVLLCDPNAGDATLVAANTEVVVLVETIVEPKIGVTVLLEVLGLLNVATVVDGVPKRGGGLLKNVPVMPFVFPA